MYSRLTSETVSENFSLSILNRHQLLSNIYRGYLRMNNSREGKVILLVDDDQDDAEIFAHIIADIDPSVQLFHVSHGASLMTHFDKGFPLPQVIFLDLNMPEISGWQCLSQLKSEQRTADIPVVIYSTSARQKDKEQARLSGATSFITKPSDYHSLRSMLLRVATALDRDLINTLRSL
jgi:CheY-like chemotaxis protein